MTFAEVLQGIFKVRSNCPECDMQVGAGQLHGVSQVWHGEPCRLGRLLAASEEPPTRAAIERMQPLNWAQPTKHNEDKEK